MKFPFSRKPKHSNPIPVPEEIKAYYQAESKDNMLKIWLLSGITFLATLVIVLAIFWGGRWMWRRSHQPSQPVATNQSDKTNDTKQGDASKSINQSTTNKSTSANNSDNSGQAASQAAPSQTQPASSSSSTTANNSTTTNANGQLIDTGPGNVDL